MSTKRKTGGRKGTPAEKRLEEQYERGELRSNIRVPNDQRRFQRAARSTVRTRSAETLQSAAVKADDSDMHPAPGGKVKLGSALAKFGREFGGVDLDIERDRAPVEPADFE